MQQQRTRAPHEHMLVALDVPNLAQASALVEQLKGQVGGFKVGLELCNSAGTPQVVEAISAAGGRVFLDLKLKDIPTTVGNAVRAIVDRHGDSISMLTLHCDGGSAMLRAAVSAVHDVYGSTNSDAPRLVGVTVLTSMDAGRLAQVGVRDSVEQQVVRLAQIGQLAGLAGVVASPHEVTAIRQACGAGFRIVTPGVRPSWSATSDQQRVMTPAEALRSGADYLVIGRPITAAAAGSGGPAGAVARIVAELTATS